MSVKKHELHEERLSGLLANYKKPEDLIGENGLLKQLIKLLVERVLHAELTGHLDYDRYESVAIRDWETALTRFTIEFRDQFSDI